MKCVVAGPNVKIFGKAVHALAKIGDELYFEPLDSGLAVRTVNGSRSAFAGFTFAPSFFLDYRPLMGTGQERFRGKIAVRSVLFVFKRLADLDKSVERCVIESQASDSRVVFRLYCKYGIVKTHKLAYIESETLVVNHDKSKAPNLIKSHPLVLIDAVACFQTGVEEITFEPQFDQMIIRNLPDDADPAKMLNVRLSLNPEEFEVYAIKGGGDDGENDVLNEARRITFCLKELRALLHFAETYASTVGLYFDVAGEPIVFAVDSDPGFEAEFVLATTTDDAEDGNDATLAPPPALNNSSQVPQRPVLTQRSRVEPARTNDGRDRRRVDPDVTLVPETDGSVSGSNRSSLLNSSQAEAKRKATLQKLMGDDDDDDDDFPPPQRPLTSIRDNNDAASNVRTRVALVKDAAFSDEEEEVPTTPPSTPPSKKFRSLFGLGSQTSSQNSLKTLTSQVTQKRAVLAADSEDEED